MSAGAVSGNVSSVLEAAAVLTRLTKLDLTNNYMTGYLPTNISFPSLEELKLVSNNIQASPCSSPHFIVQCART